MSRRIDFSKLGNEKLQYFNLEDYKDLYSSNYFCMIKRIKEFVKFIDEKDPYSYVIFREDIMFPYLRISQREMTIKYSL